MGRASWAIILISATTGCALNADNGDDVQTDPHRQRQPSISDLQPYQPPPLVTERLAFSSNRDGGYEVFTAKTDGTDVALVGPGGQPAWSWDGQKLAFVYNGTIYTANHDGSNLLPLMRGMDPAWSPDGKHLLFTTEEGIVVSATSGPFNTTPLLSHAYCKVSGVGMCATPHFSPDGSTIAFVLANPSSSLAVHVMTAAGSSPHALATGSQWTDSPTLSFDGSHIVYIKAGASGTVNVISSNLDGSNPTTLHGGFDISVPAISPDGRSVAYQYIASSGAAARIWSKLDTGSPSQLIPDVASSITTYEDVEVAWGPGTTPSSN